MVFNLGLCTQPTNQVGENKNVSKHGSLPPMPQENVLHESKGGTGERGKLRVLLQQRWNKAPE